MFARNGNILAATAASGKEAITVLGRFRMDCIVVEYHLPDLNVKEMMQTLRFVEHLDINRETPVLAISNELLTFKELRDLQILGVKNFFLKNDFLKEMDETIRQLCMPQEPSYKVTQVGLPDYLVSYDTEVIEYAGKSRLLNLRQAPLFRRLKAGIV